MLTRQQNGLISCITAQSLWGAGILFWPMLAYLNPVSLLSLRMLCSLIFATILLYCTKNFHFVAEIYHNKKSLRNLCLAAMLLTLNWGCYLYAINTGQAIEVSLGYYITPILSILLGRIIFQDTLNKNQLIAIILVVIGVAYGIISYGHVPYLGLVLGLTFACYGFLHKIVNANAISVLFVETLTVAPFTLGWLFFTEPNYGIIGYDINHYLLLLGTIFFTGIPLILFSYAAITVSFTTIGFILYLSPSINFLLAIFYKNEAVKPSDYITFPIVWIALLIYTLDMIYRAKHKTSN